MTDYFKLGEIETAAPYSLMAKYYESILSHVDYSEWYNFLDKLIVKEKIDTTKVLDISCGNGAYVRHLLSKGINAFGSDLSEMFIKMAKKEMDTKERRRFWVDDMTKPKKNGTYSSIVSLHDSVNYLTSKKALKDFFKSTAQLLEENGAIFFDITTEYNVITHFHDSSISDDIDERTSYFWNSTYNEKNKIIISHLDFLTVPKSKSGKATIQREKHKQRVWTHEEILEASEKYFNFIHHYGDFVFTKPRKTAIGVTYVMRKI